MAITPVHYIDDRWLPEQFRGKVWTTLEDTTLVGEGTVLFDPTGGAHYAGIVDRIALIGDHYHALITWYKGERNKIQDTIRLDILEKKYLWWIDPCMQEE